MAPHCTISFLTVRLCIWTPHGRCILKLGANDILGCCFADAGVLTSNFTFNEAKRFIGIRMDSLNVFIEKKIGGEVDI